MSCDARKDLLVLRKVVECLSGDHTLEYALQEITDAALALLPGDHASLRLLDVSGRLLAAARSGVGVDQSSLALAPGEGVAGWVVEHGVPAHVRDTRQDSRFVAAVGQGFAVRSIVAEPLLSAGRAMGVLSVSSSEASAFSDDDEQLARILANCSVPRLDKDRLERLALSDELTLALTANRLVHRLEEEMERARHAGSPLSVIALDLDQLERFNRAFGRELGDAILSIFAARVRDRLRRYDAFIRWGGDEFVVILPNTSPTQAATTAERLRAAVGDEPMEPRAGGRLTQTVSLGVATWNGRETHEELLRRASMAVHDAKQNGCNRVARALVVDR